MKSNEKFDWQYGKSKLEIFARVAFSLFMFACVCGLGLFLFYFAKIMLIDFPAEIMKL